MDDLVEGEITEEFKLWRDQEWDPEWWQGHQEGQLTFPHHRIPRLHGAESFPGFETMYETELGYVKRGSWQLVK